jgi:hypothetical protein
MTTPAEATSIRHEIVVEAPIERAFSVFTENFGSFKPREHNMLSVDIAKTVFESHPGGPRLRPRRRRQRVPLGARPCPRAATPVVISWDINRQWQIETDPDKTSEVEVRFIAETPERTRVELEHRYLDRHGDGWDAVREGVDSDGGWPLYLRRFADVIAA